MLIFMCAALLPALFVFFVLVPSAAPPFVRRFMLTLLTTAARTFPPTNAEDNGREYDEQKQRLNADDYTAPQQQQHALILPIRGHAAQTAPAEAVQRRFSIGRRESNVPSANTPPSHAEVTVSLASALGLSTPPTINGVERRMKKRGAHTANVASERPRRRRRHDDDTSRQESPRDGAVVRPSKRRADILVAAKNKRANVTNEPPPPPPADTDAMAVTADDTDVMTDDTALNHSQPASAPSPRSVAVILADAPPPQPSRRLHFSSNRNRTSPTTTTTHSTQYPQRRDVARIIRSGMVKPSKYERNIMREERKRKETADREHERERERARIQAESAALVASTSEARQSAVAPALTVSPAVNQLERAPTLTSANTPSLLPAASLPAVFDVAANPFASPFASTTAPPPPTPNIQSPANTKAATFSTFSATEDAFANANTLRASTLNKPRFAAARSHRGRR